MKTKVILSADQHLGIFYALRGDIFLKHAMNYFYKQFIPDIKNMMANEPSTHFELILLGDLIDSRNTLPLNILHSVNELIKTLSDILPVHIICGNHDIFNKNTNTINGINHLGWLKNVTVYTETTNININGHDVVLMPWINQRKEQERQLQVFKGKYLFTHTELNGCITNASKIVHNDPSKIEASSFSGFKRVISGHFHLHQIIGNFMYLSSIMQFDRNDYGSKKYMGVLDLETDEIKLIENTTSPIFEKIIIKTEEDLIKFEKINPNNYTDLEIYNSVIVNSRKTRKKIESILEQGSFAKIDYINDLTKIDVITEDKANIITENIDFTKLNPTTDGSVEFDTIILNYINYIDYPSDKIKEGVIEEFELVKEKHKILYGNLHS